MKPLTLIGLGALVVVGSAGVLWLAFTDIALARLALVALAVLVLGGIRLGLRSVQRDPWAGLAKPGDGPGH
jgi:hypothetical protein